jgi:hypothetical protein
MLLNKERMRNNIKTYEGKVGFLSAYHPATFIVAIVATIMLQQPFSTYLKEYSMCL